MCRTGIYDSLGGHTKVISMIGGALTKLLRVDAGKPRWRQCHPERSHERKSMKNYCTRDLLIWPATEIGSEYGRTTSVGRLGNCELSFLTMESFEVDH